MAEGTDKRGSKILENNRKNTNSTQRTESATTMTLHWYFDIDNDTLSND